MKIPVFNIQEAYEIYHRVFESEESDYSLLSIESHLPCYKQEILFFSPKPGLIIFQKITPLFRDEFLLSEFKNLSPADKDIVLRFHQPIEISTHQYLSSTQQLFHLYNTICSGRIKGEPNCVSFVEPDFYENAARIEPTEHIFEEYDYTAIFALKLMNCKNSSTIPFDPNKGIPWKGGKSGNRKPKPPYFKYEILELNPMFPKKQNPPRLKSEPSSPSEQRLHTVRGHFKTYTTEHPLFGKYTGTFWWGDCIKGNPKFGILDKDYYLKIDSSALEKLIGGKAL